MDIVLHKLTISERRTIMKFSQTFLMIIISSYVCLSNTSDTDTEDEEEEEGVDAGVLNFHDYYTCYFNKYFNISSDEENPKRDKVRREGKYYRDDNQCWK